MNDIQYPMMRAELIDYLNNLSDIEYQRRIWVLGKSEGLILHDELDYTIHFLFDDTQLASDPFSTIGVILRSSEEAKKISKLVNLINIIFQKYGTKLSDAEYIELVEWGDVVITAKEAVKLIR